MSEYNAHEIPGLRVLEPDAKIGEFSKAFFQKVIMLWLTNFKRSSRVKRH